MSKPNDVPQARVLEISRIALLKAAFPSSTDWIRSGPPLIAEEQSTGRPLSIHTAATALLRLHQRRYDLVVIPAVNLQHRAAEPLLKTAARRVLGPIGGAPILRGIVAAAAAIRPRQVILVDWSDHPEVSHETAALIPSLLAYFKRELMPDVSFRRVPAEAAAILRERVFPLPLVLPDTTCSIADEEKDSDIFFAGAMNSAERRRGLPILLSLRERGLRVDVPDERLTYHEYIRRMSGAWLVWSPEGFGWDCYRHYEACLAGSVPVINVPPHPRQLYLQHGRHCFYYDPNREPLDSTVIALLSDKQRLLEVAAAGRAHVLTHHTRAATGEYIYNTVRGLDCPAVLPAAAAQK